MSTLDTVWAWAAVASAAIGRAASTREGDAGDLGSVVGHIFVSLEGLCCPRRCPPARKRILRDVDYSVNME